MGFSFCAVWPCWSFMSKFLSNLKGFRTLLVKKLFRLKMFTLLETRITSKRFSVLFAFFEVFDRFSVLCFLAVLVMSAIF